MSLELKVWLSQSVWTKSSGIGVPQLPDGIFIQIYLFYNGDQFEDFEEKISSPLTDLTPPVFILPNPHL